MQNGFFWLKVEKIIHTKKKKKKKGKTILQYPTSKPHFHLLYNYRYLLSYMQSPPRPDPITIHKPRPHPPRLQTTTPPPPPLFSTPHTAVPQPSQLSPTLPTKQKGTGYDFIYVTPTLPPPPLNPNPHPHFQKPTRNAAFLSFFLFFFFLLGGVVVRLYMQDEWRYSIVAYWGWFSRLGVVFPLGRLGV